MAGGRKPEEPAAVISKATTAAQRVLVSTLARPPRLPPRAKTPTIIVIGEVVRLREALDWANRASPRPSDPRINPRGGG
jgi:uroporphyrin-III C-methyltransferase